MKRWIVGFLSVFVVLSAACGQNPVAPSVVGTNAQITGRTEVGPSQITAGAPAITLEAAAELAPAPQSPEGEGDGSSGGQTVAESEVTIALPSNISALSSESAWNYLNELIRYVRNGDKWNVSRWIAKMVARGIADAAIAPVVRSAFESTGHRCFNKAWWVLMPTSIWYAATCARVAS